MAVVINGTTGIDFAIPLAVTEGGTGLSSPGTSGYILTSNGTGWISAPAPVSEGILTVNGTSSSSGTIRIYEDTDNGTNYVGLKAADAITSNVVWTLPSADGTSGQSLVTNGSGTLSWTTTAASIQDDTATDTSYYPSLETSTSGSSTSVKVCSTKLYFNPNTGTLNATIFNSLSDSTQKNNVVNISNASDVIKQINGVEFDWNDNGKHSSGVVAQELEKVLPFLVNTNDKGIKSVNYSGLIAYLIECNKQLITRIEALENK